MSPPRNVVDPERWAQLRFAIIGPLLAAPPPKNQLRKALEKLALKKWTHPVTGLPHKFGFSTLERWYYSARAAQDPITVLRRRQRNDAGQTRRVSVPLRQRIQAQYKDHPGWTIQLHYDNLVAAVKEDTSLAPMPSYGTLRRFMKARGLHRRRTPKRKTAGAEQAIIVDP